MTSNKPPILLFDLDGTLLSVNSFPLWVKWMLKRQFPRISRTQQALFFGQTSSALIRRKVGLDTHAQFKKRLQNVWRNATVNDPVGLCADEFANVLTGYLRENFRPLLARIETDRYDAVLTTAAAEEYAVPLARKLGFARVICTRLSASPYKENLAETKMTNTLLELENLGWATRQRIFFTDHVDDIPLVKVCDQNFWLGDSASFEAAKQMAPGKSITWALKFEAEKMSEILPKPKSN